MKLRLGTRRSLLALAQSGWVARKLEAMNPGMQVELVGIETRGDKILDVPLRQAEGKEFFVAELDSALESGKVDLTVHSLKDLSLERPKGFRLAAVPARENPRDVIVFNSGVMDKIARGGALRIGTSSPRRIENIPSFLEKALPTVKGRKPKSEFLEIRGNVNTRLSRIHEPPSSPTALDGVVLAMAGLIRLWASSEARAQCAPLLDSVRWMVLPLRECPSAPGQGALAVECRGDDALVLGALSRLDDRKTREVIGEEREVLRLWGGGCHQKFGATAFFHPELGKVLIVRGKSPQDEPIDLLSWESPAPPSGKIVAWNGAEGRSGGETALPFPEIPAASAVFVAHSRALKGSLPESARLWTSGVSSWFSCAERGLWVEGCADSLGFDSIRTTLSEPLLRLPKLADWKVLTHDQAREGWDGVENSPQVIATYRVASREVLLPENVTHFFWSSGSQFESLKSQVRPGREHHHACGPGKTARHLRENGMNPQVFPSAEEWKKWLESV